MMTDNCNRVARGVLVLTLCAAFGAWRGLPVAAVAQEGEESIAPLRPVSSEKTITPEKEERVREAHPVSSERVITPEKEERVRDARPAPLPAKPEKKSPGAGHAKSNGNVTFDFKDADITNILRIFSLRYGINIVAGPEVKGKVTIRLTDVPWETALKLVLQSNNFTYVREENVFRVISRDQIDKEPLETKVFPLSYATAGEIQNSITHLLTPQRGQIKADARSNTLVVTDVPGKLDQISMIIKRLDKRTPQVLIEARILELTDDFDENIGIDWVSLKGYNVQVAPGEDGLFSWSREEIRTTDDTTTKTYNDVDVYRSEQLSGIGKSLGTDTTFGDPVNAGTVTETETIIDSSGTDPSGTKITTSSNTGERNKLNMSGSIFEDGYTAEGIDMKSKGVTTSTLAQAVLKPDAFNVTLNFLQEQGDASLISHPKLVTADNKESVIKVVTQWPMPDFQFNDDTGQWEVSGFNYKDIGIILTVTPHVNEDDFINMSVVPEVSSILGTTTFSGATGAELPIISTRTAETEVLVRNGDTLAIGGLMREDELVSVNKVPLVGDIPLIGPYLFSFSQNQIEKSNIIIFVTANLVTEDNKDSFWITQNKERLKRLNLPATKWWEPKKLRYGLGANPAY